MDEELNERVNGGDSDYDGENIREIEDTMREVELERSHVLLGDDGIEKTDEGGMKFVLLHVGETMDPDEVKVPKSPYDQVDPPPNTSKGGANFDKMDNPGGWSSFSYHPVFASGSQAGQYKAHFSQMSDRKCLQMKITLQTCSSPRWTFFLHALSFECTSKLCITFLNQFSVYFHI